MEDPWDLYPGLAARPASGQFLPFPRLLFIPRCFTVALNGLTANASLDCLCFAEVYVDREGGAPPHQFPLFASGLW